MGADGVGFASMVEVPEREAEAWVGGHVVVFFISCVNSVVDLKMKLCEMNVKVVPERG